MFSQKYSTEKSICIWFEPKMKMWVYLFILIIVILIIILAIVSAISKGIDLKFSAYSELVGVS